MRMSKYLKVLIVFSFVFGLLSCGDEQEERIAIPGNEDSAPTVSDVLNIINTANGPDNYPALVELGATKMQFISTFKRDIPIKIKLTGNSRNVDESRANQLSSKKLVGVTEVESIVGNSTVWHVVLTGEESDNDDFSVVGMAKIADQLPYLILKTL